MLKFNEDFTSLISSSTDKKIIKWDLAIMRVLSNHTYSLNFSLYQPQLSYEIEKKGAISPIYFDMIYDENYLIFNVDDKINVYNMTTRVIFYNIIHISS